MAADAATTHDEARAAFELGKQLELAFARLAELGRELDRVRNDVVERDATLLALQDTWRTLDGRTLRHDAGLDTVRELRTLVEDLGGRLEQESALRREAVAALGQAGRREGDAAERADHHVVQVDARVVSVEQQARASEAERQHLFGSVGALQEQAERSAARIDQLELRLGAARDAERSTAVGLADVEGRFPALVAAIGALEVQTREGQADRRAIADAVNALRTTRDREAELLDLLEQQRSTRHRVEARLMATEEGLSEVGRALLEAAEQRAQLRVQVTNVERRLDELAAGFEQQRELVQRHLRAILDADDVAATRTVTEIERRTRERRELLRRLNEESEQASGGPQ